MTTDKPDDIPHEPPEAFAEHLPLSQETIEHIQAVAATNVNRQLNENEGNDPNPHMEIDGHQL